MPKYNFLFNKDYKYLSTGYTQTDLLAICNAECDQSK